MNAFSKNYYKILRYHSIESIISDRNSVSLNNFVNQLQWLKENKYEFIQINNLLNLIKNRKHKELRKKIVITFDSGYKNFIEVGFNVLNKYNIPATIFLVTEMIGKKAYWIVRGKNHYILSNNDINYLQSHNITFGSHSALHCNLTMLRNHEIYQQLKESYETIKQLGETTIPLAYPWGQWSSKVIDHAKAIGYSGAVTSSELTRKFYTVDSFLLPRTTIHAGIDMDSFMSIFTESPCNRLVKTFIRSISRRQFPHC